MSPLSEALNAAQRSALAALEKAYVAGQALLEETHDIKLVQKLLGHADPATTMQHYVDYDEFQLADHMIRMLERRRGE